MEVVFGEGRIDPPLVSVITVARNALSDLRITIASVLSQDYSNIQFIVIDGGSTDGSYELLEDHHERLTYISEKDSGIYDAMNKGVGQVKGEWMIFLNAGDRFADSNAIKTFVSNLDKNTSLVYSDYFRPTSRDHNKLERCYSRPLVDKCGVIRMICHQAILFSVAHFPGRYDCTLRLCADLDILLNIYKNGKGKLKYLRQPLVIYQGGGVSESDYSSLHMERTKVIKRHFSWLFTLVNSINHLRIRCLRAFSD